MTKPLLIVITLMIIFSGAYFITRNFSSSPTPQPPPANVGQTPPPASTGPTAEVPPPARAGSGGKTVVINMTDSGFQPDKVTIKQNDIVKFVNVGKDDHWPASNIHPTHLIYPEFDPKRPISPGDSWSFVFDKIGIWRCHDHLDPTISCVITVEQ